MMMQNGGKLKTIGRFNAGNWKPSMMSKQMKNKVEQRRKAELGKDKIIDKKDLAEYGESNPDLENQDPEEAQKEKDLELSVDEQKLK